jgi:sensor histidine kinase YesM
MDTSPSFLHAFYRRLHWHQLILLVGLTTLAVLIIIPYFAGGHDCSAKLAASAAASSAASTTSIATGEAAQAKETICPTYSVRFGRLWFRLFIVALVMFVSFLTADLWWRRREAELEQPRLSLLTTQLIAVSLGAFVGTVISGLIIGRSLAQMFATEPMLLGILVFTTVGIGIGAVTATLLVYRSRAARADADIAKAEAARYELEKQVLASRLKLMQAQIEPHFLFNTLANVQHLTESDPPLASKTLQSLITYLRAALPEMREGSSTLGREMTMAIAYLDIQKVRMGTRLNVSVNLPEPLARTAFPPMMLLTLIENAIKHGLDPAPDGGKIVIAAKFTDGTLTVSVADTGHGLSMAKSIGVGLTNIRERLATLYGKAANLQLAENTPSGVVATISIQQ